MKKEIEEFRSIIDRSRRIVFFGGAGVSTASGIPDFRSENGLNKYYSTEEILSASFFTLHTGEFYEFYRKYMVHPEAEPNVVHRWLYELEKRDKLRGIVTQNIDGLHRIAGNKRVYELHGSIYENYCMGCETFYPLEAVMGRAINGSAEESVIGADGVPRCSRCGGVIKPYVVLYGEAPDKYTMIGACREISGADTMIIAGTSLAVEPAASLIGYFAGRNLVIVNKEATLADDIATLLIRGDIAAVVSGVMENAGPGDAY